jgi:two-component system OmpR family sensor kinase
LGLAIVQKVVADHDGVVDVSSRPGETVFTLMLPQERAQETLASGRPPAMPQAGGGRAETGPAE